MHYTNHLKIAVVFVIAFVFTFDTSFSVLAQARAEEAAQTQGFISSMYDKATAAADASIKKCQ